VLLAPEVGLHPKASIQEIPPTHRPPTTTHPPPRKGDQPDGTMTVRTHRRGVMPLSGHESEGTIVIQYNFPSGTQGPKHPNPGTRYHGTTRSAYLPVSVFFLFVVLWFRFRWPRLGYPTLPTLSPLTCRSPADHLQRQSRFCKVLSSSGVAPGGGAPNADFRLRQGICELSGPPKV